MDRRRLRGAAASASASAARFLPTACCRRYPRLPIKIKTGYGSTADGWQLMRKNCCHFCDEVLVGMGMDPLPRWVTRLASAGAAITGLFH